MNNKSSIESSYIKIQNALDFCELNNLEPTQDVIADLAKVSRRSVCIYKELNEKRKRIKREWKEKNKIKNDNSIPETIESKLSTELDNYRQQNSLFFYEIKTLKEQISKFNKENFLIVKENEKLKKHISSLILELNNIKNDTGFYLMDKKIDGGINDSRTF